MKGKFWKIKWRRKTRCKEVEIKKGYNLADKESRAEEKSEDMKREVVDSMMNGRRKLVGLRNS